MKTGTHVYAMLFLLPALAALSSCLSQQEPFIVVLDDAYSLRLLATNEDGFAAPDGLLLLPGGEIVLADEVGSAVSIWKDGMVTRSLCNSTSGIISPEDLVRDANDDIYFTDDSAGGLWRIDAAGKLDLVAGPEDGLLSTEGIASAPDGTILVGDGKQHKIFRVTRRGEVTVFAGEEYHIEKAEAMAFDEKGNLFIADDESDVVYEISSDGILRHVIDGDDGLQAPESMCYRNGVIYLTDDAAGEVLGYDLAAGKLHIIAVFHGVLHRVQGITVDEQGNIFVTVHDWPPKESYIFVLERK
jgi:sugar lactone lactonase YvrE